MFGPKSRIPATISLVGSVLGLVFATNSTVDYATHLDRRLHDLHCSFIPGAPPESGAEACRVAMYSPYAAFFREKYWGGIPISLFALGAFAFFAGYALYLLIAAERAPRRAVTLFGLVSVTPLLVSILMFTISATQLGTFCKTCIGIYISSFVLALGGLFGLFTTRGPDAPGAEPRPEGSWVLALAWLPALGAVTLIPAAVYASAVPDHRPYLSKCGTLKKDPTAGEQLLHFASGRSVKQALFFEDPLCPTCKAFHARLKAEGVLDRLDVQLALFPLDSECNWMLDNPLHPGSCLVSRAILCSGDRALKVLEWSYDEQEDVAKAGKAGPAALKALVEKKWGGEVGKCMESPDSKARLNKHLHFATDNGIPVSTPQVYLGKQRICDEDTDMGLRFTLKQLAPEVLQ